MIIEKLPALFQANSLIIKFAQFIEGKKVLFSSIVYLNQGKKYIIAKTPSTPYFSNDWQCYSLSRCYASTLITTGILQIIKGSILRNEKDLFKSYFACGDQQIE